MERAPRPTGFTLVEMLVTTVVLSALCLVLLSILDKSSTAWNQAEQRIDAFREARVALHVIVRDLRGLLAPPGVNFIYLNGQDASTGTPAISISGKTAPSSVSDSFFFLSAQPHNAQTASDKSDACIVGYFNAYSVDADPTQSLASPSSSFKLYRHFRRSDDTFADLQKVVTQGTLFARAAAFARGTYDEALAMSIIDFQVRLYQRKSDGTLEELDPWPRNSKPALAEISLAALDETTSRRLTDEAAWLDPANPTRTEKLRRFSTRITTGP